LAGNKTSYRIGEASAFKRGKQENEKWSGRKGTEKERCPKTFRKGKPNKKEKKKTKKKKEKGVS